MSLAAQPCPALRLERPSHCSARLLLRRRFRPDQTTLRKFSSIARLELLGPLGDNLGELAGVRELTVSKHLSFPLEVSSRAPPRAGCRDYLSGVAFVPGQLSPCAAPLLAMFEVNSQTHSSSRVLCRVSSRSSSQITFFVPR